MSTDGTPAAAPEALRSGELFHFGSWPSTPVPRGRPGVYTIWQGNEFLYVGISWREGTADREVRGLWGRLDSHASGRRPGDQFCIYICDRFVIPTLSAEAIRTLSTGARTLDPLTKEYIRTNLGYRYITTETGAAARRIESQIRRHGLDGHGQPMINPSG